MRTLSIACIVASLALPLAAFAFSPAEAPTAGQQATDFTLPSQDGTKLGLKDFKGKWIVLYFYPKDNTPGCTVEARNFQRDLAKYEQQNAVVVGVRVDSVDSHQDFCTKQGLTFKLLADTDKKMVDAYGSLRPNGVAARNTFLIAPNGKIAKVWMAVQPPLHSEEVLAALAELKK